MFDTSPGQAPLVTVEWLDITGSVERYSTFPAVCVLNVGDLREAIHHGEAEG